jgi:plastocyanin
MRKLIVLVAVAAVAVIAFAVVPAQSATTVAVKDYKFVKRSVTVGKGGTVKWKWEGRAPHNVKFATFSSGTPKTRDSFSHKFTKKGTFSYMCTRHPGMTGKITVK